MQTDTNPATGTQEPLPPSKKKVSRLVVITAIAVVLMLTIGIINLLTPGGRNLAPLAGSAEPTVTPNAPPITPIANATPVPTPVNTVLAVLPDAIIDKLDNWSKTQNRGVNLALDNTNPDRFEGDTGRIKRLISTPEEIIWKQDGMKFFEATAYFWPGEEVSHFDVLTSTDATSWQIAKPVIAGGTGDWKKFTYTLNGLSNVNFVMIRWNNQKGSSWNPQLAGVVYSKSSPDVAGASATTAVAAAPSPTAAPLPTATSTIAATPTTAPTVTPVPTATRVPPTATVAPTQVPPVRVNLVGHNGAVNIFSWTKDGRYFATTGDDRTVKIWEAATNKIALTLEDNIVSPVLALGWSSDNEYLVAAHADKTVRVYRIFPKGAQPSGRLWFEASDGVAAPIATLSADDALLPYLGVGVLGTWNLKRNAYGPKFPLIGELTALAFSPDNRLLVMGMSDGRVQFWDINSVTLLETVEATTSTSNAPTKLSWTPDGRQLVVGRQKSFEVLQVNSTGDRLNITSTLAQPAKAPVTSLAVSADNNRLAVGSSNGTVQLWSLADNKSSQEIAGNGSPAIALNWSADGAQITIANGGTQPGLLKVVPNLRSAP